MRSPNALTREIVKNTKDGPKTYTYYKATWREDEFGGKLWFIKISPDQEGHRI